MNFKIKTIEVTQPAHERENTQERIHRDPPIFETVTKELTLSFVNIPERETREWGAGRVLDEIVAGNFPNLAKDTNLEIQEPEEILSNVTQRNLGQDPS